MSQHKTIVIVKRLADADQPIQIAVRSLNGLGADAEVAPGEELVIRLERGEELKISEV
jgi:hypothetical protein